MSKNLDIINFRKYLRIEIFLFLIIRFSFLFIEPIARAGDVIEAFLQGEIFYCSPGIPNHEWVFTSHFFPPVIYYLYTLEFFVFGPLINSINPFFLIFEFLNYILVYKMVLLFNQKKDAIVGNVLLIFFPLSLIFLIFLEPSIFALTFTLASLYFFLQDRKILSSVFAALGAAVLFLPAIILFPILFYYFKHQKLKDFIIYIMVFILSLLIICLPFLIICPQGFIDSMVLSINTPQSSNIGNIILGDLLQTSIFSILNFEFKIQNIIQIGILLLSLLFFNKKYKKPDKKDVLTMIIFYFYLIMVLTFYIHPRFLYWTFILIIVILPYETINQSEDINKLIKKCIYISIPFGILSVFCLLYSRNFVIFSNFSIHMDLIILYLFLFNILWILFAFFIFPNSPMIKNFIISNAFANFGFLLYKLFYEYSNLQDFNIILSYFIIFFIIYLVYFHSFSFLDINFIKKKKSILINT